MENVVTMGVFTPTQSLALVVVLVVLTAAGFIGVGKLMKYLHDKWPRVPEVF